MKRNSGPCSPTASGIWSSTTSAVTTFVMLAIETASPADATTPSIPATETDALPTPGQVSAAGAAAIGSTCTPSTVGGTACRGHSRVVAE